MLSGSLLSSLPSCRPPRHAGHALHARLPWLSWHSRSTSRHALHGGALSEWISFTDGAMTYRSSLVMDPKPPSLHGSHNRILGEWHNQQQLTKLGFHCWHTHMPREYP